MESRGLTEAMSDANQVFQDVQQFIHYLQDKNGTESTESYHAIGEITTMQWENPVKSWSQTVVQDLLLIRSIETQKEGNDYVWSKASQTIYKASH